MSAEERREQVIRAAVTEFSIRGFEGTSTSDIAKRVGVSQPYLFRLFPTKKDLFIEACTRGSDRIGAVFAQAAEGKYGQDALFAMGGAYQQLLNNDRELLMMQHQQFAACHDEEIQAKVRAGTQRLWILIETLSGAPLEARVGFFARGMLCNVIAAMGSGDSPDVSQWSPILQAMRSLTAVGTSPATDAEDVDADADAAGVTGDAVRLEDERRYAEYIESSLLGTGQSGVDCYAVDPRTDPGTELGDEVFTSAAEPVSTS